MRQIICEDCIREVKKIAKQSPPTEIIKFTKGRAIMAMFCDYCAKLILERKRCYAKTVSTITSPIEAGWEKEYIK